MHNDEDQTIAGIPLAKFMSNNIAVRAELQNQQIEKIRTKHTTLCQYIQEVNQYYGRCKQALQQQMIAQNRKRLNKTTREKILKNVDKPKHINIPDKLLIKTSYATHGTPKPPYPPKLKGLIETTTLELVEEGYSLKKISDALDVWPRIRGNGGSWFCGQENRQKLLNSRKIAVESMMFDVHDMIDCEPDVLRAKLKVEMLKYEAERIHPEYTPKRQQATADTGGQVVVLDFRKNPETGQLPSKETTKLQIEIERNTTPQAQIPQWNGDDDD